MNSRQPWEPTTISSCGLPPRAAGDANFEVSSTALISRPDVGDFMVYDAHARSVMIRSPFRYLSQLQKTPPTVNRASRTQPTHQEGLGRKFRDDRRTGSIVGGLARQSMSRLVTSDGILLDVLIDQMKLAHSAVGFWPRRR